MQSQVVCETELPLAIVLHSTSKLSCGHWNMVCFGICPVGQIMWLFWQQDFYHSWMSKFDSCPRADPLCFSCYPFPVVRLHCVCLAHPLWLCFICSGEAAWSWWSFLEFRDISNADTITDGMVRSFIYGSRIDSVFSGEDIPPFRHCQLNNQHSFIYVGEEIRHLSLAWIWKRSWDTVLFNEM